MERSFESAAALVGCTAGPISEHLGSFVDLLVGQQFVGAVVYVKAMHAAAFDRWLAQNDVGLAELSEAHIQRFLRRRRRHRGPIQRETRRREEYDVQQVLGFLRSRSLCAQAIASSTPVEDLVAAFARHLREQQGLASPTIERYTIVARQFLEKHFSAGEIDMCSVVATDIIEFVRGQAAHLRPPGLKCVVTAMRSFLRYGQYRGDVANEIVAAVPAVAAWATTPALPRAISPEHAQRAIDSCDLGTAIGLRDRAILLILARLGLRANEVIALQLGDFDWDRGQVQVLSKGGRECLLPIPNDVGSAISAYLERGRPVSNAPAHAAQTQRVLAIPAKRFTRTLVPFLSRPEVDALLAAPDLRTWSGRRDHALILLAVQTGLRLSELTGLVPDDLQLGAGAHVRVIGKGRKERCTPLSKSTRAVLTAWTREPPKVAGQPVFPNAQGGRLSAHGVQYLLAKHVAAAAATCPSLTRKRVSPHVLRHTTAMDLLQEGVDRSVIALWLGHESIETTQMYLDADLELKQRVLDRTTPPTGRPGRYRPDDKLLDFLNGL